MCLLQVGFMETVEAWWVTSGSEWHFWWNIMYTGLTSSGVGARKLRNRELCGSLDAFACDLARILMTSLANFLLYIFICIPSLPVFPFLTFWTPLYLKHSQIIYLFLRLYFNDSISPFPFFLPMHLSHQSLFTILIYPHITMGNFWLQLKCLWSFIPSLKFLPLQLIFSQPWYKILHSSATW